MVTGGNTAPVFGEICCATIFNLSPISRLVRAREAPVGEREGENEKGRIIAPLVFRRRIIHDYSTRAHECKANTVENQPIPHLRPAYTTARTFLRTFSLPLSRVASERRGSVIAARRIVTPSTAIVH